jgi:hypothetical protein
VCEVVAHEGENYSSSKDATYLSTFSSLSPMKSENDSSSIVGTAPRGFTAPHIQQQQARKHYGRRSTSTNN